MDNRPKRLAVIGSTGSIGQQTLAVVRTFPERFQVVGLAAGTNAALLAEQVLEFHPAAVAISSARADELLRAAPAPRTGGFDLMSSEDIVRLPGVDLVVIATAGKAGLGPTLAAIGAGKPVALANKEVLVAAGEIVTREVRQHNSALLPLDSEHSAIWQCLVGEPPVNGIRRLILTASGGALRDLPEDRLAQVTVAEALAHPTWRMGKKVTIDSATLMNKGMETIEARWLFNVPMEKVEVVVHRQSIVHSLVEFEDGSVKAQLGCPDMRLPIQYALTYPERWPIPLLPRLDLVTLGTLCFEPPDLERFPCLGLALEAGRRGGTYGAALCGADEVAVDLFLQGKIRFTDIPRLVERALEQHTSVSEPSLDDILAADAWARDLVAHGTGAPV